MVIAWLAVALALDPREVQPKLAEARRFCEPGGLRLWNRSLCGPMVAVDPRTRQYVTEAGESGQLPPEQNVANTAFDWRGQKWTMVLWPLPVDEAARRALLAHELWHRIQGSLGFPPTGPANAHLDTLDGRLWLRLEWRALGEALRTEGEARRAAVADALAFRNKRRALFARAAEEERQLEMHEGLAEYTGVALSGDAVRLAVADLERGETAAQYARSFAYASGPAYGLLLDEARPAWRDGLTPQHDLGVMLAQAWAVTPRDAVLRAAHYGGAALRQEEAAREKTRLERARQWRTELVEGPVLVMPARELSLSFDPSRQTSLDAFGTVYESLRVTAEWGVFEAREGALIPPSFDRVVAPKPDPGGRRGAGWTLELKPGWTVRPGPREGDWQVVAVPRNPG
jgi:hypothetical protein